MGGLGGGKREGGGQGRIGGGGGVEGGWRGGGSDRIRAGKQYRPQGAVLLQSMAAPELRQRHHAPSHEASFFVKGGLEMCIKARGSCPPRPFGPAFSWSASVTGIN